MFILKAKMVKVWKFLPHITEPIDKVNVVCIIK
jgi:hypothetical protein